MFCPWQLMSTPQDCLGMCSIHECSIPPIDSIAYVAGITVIPLAKSHSAQSLRVLIHPLVPLRMGLPLVCSGSADGRIVVWRTDSWQPLYVLLESKECIQTLSLALRLSEAGTAERVLLTGGTAKSIAVLTLGEDSSEALQAVESVGERRCVWMTRSRDEVCCPVMCANGPRARRLFA